MKKRLATLLAALALLAVPVGVFAQLKTAGPIHPVNKYPMWYEDKSAPNLFLQFCDDFYGYTVTRNVGGVPVAILANALPCIAFPPNNAPIAYPTNPANPATGNWPVENFYFAAQPVFDGKDPVSGARLGATDPVSGAAANLPDKRQLLVFALEATYAANVFEPGQEVVFSRYRVRITGLQPLANYAIKHPFNPVGDVFQADDAGAINATRDIGIAAGAFGLALNGTVKPNFLTWPNFADPLQQARILKNVNDTLVAAFAPNPPPTVFTALPGTYIGDPGIPEVVVGGVGGFNKVRIDGPAVGLAETAPGSGVFTTVVNQIETPFFFVSGKIAKTFGVQPGDVTYTRLANGGTMDVFATTAPHSAPFIPIQDIQASLGGATYASLVPGGTGFAMNNGEYEGQFAFAGLPPTVTLKNATDPVAFPIAVTPVDKVFITQAEYAIDPALTGAAGMLTVKASSSDKVTLPIMNVYDEFGPLESDGVTPREAIGQIVGGSMVAFQDVAPSKVVVVSPLGGRATATVMFSNAPFLPAATGKHTHSTVFMGS